ncbi:MAG: TlpA family protein disulfide reductase [Methyloceanibacter sp.]
MSKTNRRDRDAPPATTYFVAAVLAAIAGLGTVYVSFGPAGNGRLPISTPDPAASDAAAPPQSASQAGPLGGLNKGAMAAFLVRSKPQELPEISVAQADGATKPFSDWRGKVVLLNIWATWCHPCREEMPTLDKLEAALGGSDFEVVAVNIDKGGTEKVKTFLQETGVNHLAVYTDPSSKLFSALKAVGMPTTLLINREGYEIGRLVGPADWDSPEALALIKAAIAGPKVTPETGDAAGASPSPPSL